MKKTYIGFNLLLVIMISATLFYKPNQENIASKTISKSLTTTSFKNAIEVIEQKQAVEQAKIEEQKKVEEEAKKQEEAKKVAAVPTPEASTNLGGDAVETQVGSLAAYGPDCAGCSGRLASGFNAAGGNHYYSDATYGNIRILAGDRKYPFGTVVRISGTRLGTFNAIVLDRGGGVGFGKRFLFDLLCPSEANASSVGSFHNVTFEILRYGY